MELQIQKLNKKLKSQLGSRILKDDRKVKAELTKDEILMIEQFISMKYRDYKLPILVKISNRYHHDFIWWDQKVDVLLCLNSK